MTAALRQNADVNSELLRALGRIEGQIVNFDKRLDDHARTSETAINALRQDVVHANTEMRRQVTDHETRINSLESDRAARVGAFKLATFLKDFSPWIVAGLIGLVAYVK